MRPGPLNRRALVFAALLVPAQAVAQEAPRFEFGGTVGALVPVFAPGLLVASAGPRFTLNLGGDTAIDAAVDVIGPIEGSGLHGLYDVQARHVLRKRRGTQRSLFATGGFGGYFRYAPVPERRQERPDRSVVVYPAHAVGELYKPDAVVAGIGTEQLLTPHLVMRAEVGAWLFFEGGLVARAAVGLSIPVGGKYP